MSAVSNVQRNPAQQWEMPPAQENISSYRRVLKKLELNEDFDTFTCSIYEGQFGKKNADQMHIVPFLRTKGERDFAYLPIQVNDVLLFYSEPGKLADALLVDQNPSTLLASFNSTYAFQNPSDTAPRVSGKYYRILRKRLISEEMRSIASRFSLPIEYYSRSEKEVLAITTAAKRRVPIKG